MRLRGVENIGIPFLCRGCFDVATLHPNEERESVLHVNGFCSQEAPLSLRVKRYYTGNSGRKWYTGKSDTPKRKCLSRYFTLLGICRTISLERSLGENVDTGIF